MPLIPIHTCSWSCDLLLFRITVAQFSFFLVHHHIISGPSVLLFHMDTRVGGWGCLTACCHILHARFLKVTVLKEATGLDQSSPASWASVNTHSSWSKQSAWLLSFALRRGSRGHNSTDKPTSRLVFMLNVFSEACCHCFLLDLQSDLVFSNLV